VSSNGEVFPSGFLPVSGGTLREKTLAAIYRESPVFLNLRDASLLKGRCGRCEYRDLCGGSRSRAWAVTGDYLEEDPCCGYQPG
jgi:radical SAM protein with 4Fe4S-binding SPASM domain